MANFGDRILNLASMFRIFQIQLVLILLNTYSQAPNEFNDTGFDFSKTLMQFRVYKTLLYCDTKLKSEVH